MLSNHFLYRINRCQPLARYISQILLQPAQNSVMTYQAGQYLDVIHADNSRSHLSIACAPVDLTCIELHLRHRPGNTKAQDILHMIKQDQQLLICGPFGACTLARYALDMPLIFLARSTGFSPIKAQLEELILQRDTRPIYFYWGVDTEEDFYFLDLILQWQETLENFYFIPVLGGQNKLQRAVLNDFDDLAACQMYASGSAKMVYGALEFFTQHGLVAGRFYSDLL